MRWNFGSFSRRQTRAWPEGPFRDELLGAQRLDDRALTIAARFTIHPRARARSILPRFEDNARVLQSAYQTLAGDVRAGRFITSASSGCSTTSISSPPSWPACSRNLPQAYYRAARARISPFEGYQGLCDGGQLLRHSDSQLIGR